MGIQDLRTFFDGNCVQGGTVAVDLLKIARLVAQRQRNRVMKGQQLSNTTKLRLVLDGECCLDRLYAGYFSGDTQQLINIDNNNYVGVLHFIYTFTMYMTTGVDFRV